MATLRSDEKVRPGAAKLKSAREKLLHQGESVRTRPEIERTSRRERHRLAVLLAETQLMILGDDGRGSEAAGLGPTWL